MTRVGHWRKLRRRSSKREVYIITSHYISQETYGGKQKQTGCVGADRYHEKVAVIGEKSTCHGFFICKNKSGNGL